MKQELLGLDEIFGDILELVEALPTPVQIGMGVGAGIAALFWFAPKPKSNTEASDKLVAVLLIADKLNGVQTKSTDELEQLVRELQERMNHLEQEKAE